ncbi:Rieske 2Fe-2S domain-containing protein [uncultured Shimia sp.]|uniref:Rieske 2Fe-2S domain-containing protein n=1 Tax=uncultured Shimia sp. TaxID=573152 RepID=UPI0026357198|nr:Rieske 2Fe-2S domain-containing protein [uncultured Shimia sp.]
MTLTLKLTAKDSVIDRIDLFTFEAIDGASLPNYTAGAHLDFELGAAGTRSYSLIDFERRAGNARQLQVAVQREDKGDGGSKAMHALEVGDTIETTEPKNDFELHSSEAPTILIAGGIGVTPIISFAAELHARGARYQFHYATRSRENCAFAGALTARFADALTLWFDNESQMDLQSIIADAPSGAHFFCCGPKGMIEAVRELAEAQGIAKDHIHFELFASPRGHEGDKPFEVEIADGRVFTIPADKTIVEVLEAKGIDATFDCQRGDCGICQTKVLGGIPDHRDVVLSKSERDSGKVMQICVSRAKSNRLKLDIGAPASKAKTRAAERRSTMGNNTTDADAIRALVQQHQVHRDTYIDKEIYELEMKHLFSNTWVFVGHDSQTLTQGDYITTQIGNQPVIMVRHTDDQIYVLYNRCPHKGTKIAIDRSGNTGKFFRCPYHAWSFKTDGCLLAIPLKKGYAETDFEDSEANNGLESVGAVKNYRGFVFARLAKEGMSFEDYFGDAMSSFDNMVDRAPAGRLEVAGPPLRYMHQCNWKMLVDNQTDTCHPMVAHESSAGTAVRLFEEANWPADKPKPMAMEIIAPFMSPYEFFEEMGIRTWPNGHGHTGVHHSIHSDYSQDPEYWNALVEAYGEEKAAKTLGENRHNTVYWPNIMIKGPVQQLRNFIPLGPDKTLVESYIYRLVGAPDYLLQRTAMYNRLINAPTSMVGHDDLEMYERAQEGLHAQSTEWINIQRLHTEEEDYDEIAVENGTTERQMRNQMNAWVKFMTMSMEPETEAAE